MLAFALPPLARLNRGSSVAITTRPITEDEVPVFLKWLRRGFGEDPSEDGTEEDREADRFRALAPLERTVAAFDGDAMVGTLATFPLDVTVPGFATLAMAGTTMVTVQPTHRRRGVLTAMMRDHLDDAIGRGEALAGLWASEGAIYGRYGFGPATERDEVDAVQTHIEVSGPGGEMRFIDLDQAAAVLAPVYDAVASMRPGMLSRTQAWWDRSTLYDSPRDRGAMSAPRVAVHHTAGTADGYTLYDQKGGWDEGFGNGELRVWEVIATTEQAHTGLWRFLTNIDLFPRVKYWNMPVDDPLRWKVTDARRLVRKRHDGMWIRVLDVPAALAARSFAADGTIRLGIADPFLPNIAGTYELTVSDGRGECRRTDRPADITLDIAALGSLYLGGGHAIAAARAGRITGDNQAVVQLSRMFHGDLDPWCPEIF
jgi:predicted acetyltransferase